MGVPIDFEPYTMEDLVERVLMNVGRRRRKLPRWAHVSDAFAMGSTYSRELCRAFGMDPDEEIGTLEDLNEEDTWRG